ncbi:Zinc finger, CCHC-type [Parasponia andersonii]|uniref:Zinc finger, CCHC-type n=1 Tax=Parasponia andersonii TaxID=3476 RepID=A0A2P5ACH9_PARAD|nr:Zinc finger, CCHC-type [Parasponia andersonii]
MLLPNILILVSKPYSSHRGGHNHGQGRGAGRGGRENFNHQNKPICQVCGKAGHVAVKCYHRFDLSYQGPDSSSSSHFPQNKPSLLVLLLLMMLLGIWIVGLLIM